MWLGPKLFKCHKTLSILHMDVVTVYLGKIGLSQKNAFTKCSLLCFYILLLFREYKILYSWSVNTFNELECTLKLECNHWLFQQLIMNSIGKWSSIIQQQTLKWSINNMKTLSACNSSFSCSLIYIFSTLCKLAHW